MDTLTRDPEPADLGSVHAPDDTGTHAAAGPLQVELAVMSFGAAVIHAAFAPAHFAESWSHGAFFVAAAWFQVLVGMLLLLRPRRWVYRFALANVVVIGAWVLSRTVGAPFGPDAWSSEPVGFPDVVATALEACIVAGSLAVLARPILRIPARWTGAAIAGVAGLALVVAGTTTASLTPRYAGEHTHGNGEAAAHVHDGGDASVTAGFVLTGQTPCEKSGPPASEGSINDAEGHNHRGPVPQVALDEPTRALLEQQQALARSVASKYPTVADAEAAGYVQSTPFVPCIGAHYTNVSLVFAFDPSAPSELLFDGTRPDSKIIGLSYLVYHPGGPPEGFAGPNDHWHQHNANGGLCMSNATGIVIGAEQLSAEQCAAIGGHKQPLPDVWMLHDWVVPGWECSWGVFAPECPELGGTAGRDAWS